MFFASGTYFSHHATPAVSNANTRMICGDYTHGYTPFKLSVTDYGQFTAGTSYIFRFPLIMNPPNQYDPFTYQVQLLQYNPSIYYPVIVS